MIPANIEAQIEAKEKELKEVFHDIKALNHLIAQLIEQRNEKIDEEMDISSTIADLKDLLAEEKEKIGL